MSTPVTNFPKVTVSTGYDAAATSVVLTTGHGARLAATSLGSYWLVWWNATDYADPADDPNREIVLVTTRSGDTLTVTRAQGGTSATTKNTGGKTYKMLQGITKEMVDEWNRRALSQSFSGVQLQSHPDSDVRLKKVRLIHADAIVMNDGEEVGDWNDVDFDITAAAGIGGLDTGSEAASTWYKIFAMWNGTTKGLMGQRSKDYKLDVQYVTGEDASQGLRSAVDNSTVKVAQGVQFATAGPLEFVDLKLLRTGSPVGNFWVTIEANNAGVPSNTPLATSDKFNAARISTTAQWVRIPFRTPFSVSASTQYHLVLQGDYAVSASNFLSVRMDGSAATYANGAKALFNSDTATWTTDTDDDLQFSAYVTQNDSGLVVPTGYRYAQIGWAYNNSGSDLVQFRQIDRTWQYADLAPALVVNETVANATLIDLRTFLPAWPCRAWFGLTGTGAATATASLGDLKSTDVVAGAAGPATIQLFCGSTAEVVGGWGPVLNVEYNAIMLDATAAADLYLNAFSF